MMERIRCSYPLAFVLALMLLFDSGGDLLLLLAAAAIHELGHIGALMLMGAGIRCIRLTLGGAVIEYNGSRVSYLGDAAAALAGPAASLLTCFVMAATAGPDPSELLCYFAGLNLMLGLFNLAPVMPLDGGRAVLCLLCAVRSPREAEQISGLLTGIAGCGLLLVGGGLLLKAGNPSLLLISLVVLLSDGDKTSLQERIFGLL